MPEPDLLLLEFQAYLYAERLPKPADVLLLIEAGDPSAAFDRNVKLPLYAAAGIAEVWLEDLAKRRLTVYSEPSTRGSVVEIEVGDEDVVAPVALPDLTATGAEILGPA